jgi:hypothetical protein
VNIISIIALLGTAQGVFLTLTLFAWQKGNRRANAILAIIFALMSLAMWNVYLNTSGLYRTLTFSIRVYDALRLLTGPLIYWYVREMVVRPLRWRDFWHLLPTVVYIVWLIPFFMSSDTEKIRFMEQTLEGASYQYVIFAALRPWWTLGYMIAALRLLMEYSRRIKRALCILGSRGAAMAVEYRFGIIRNDSDGGARGHWYTLGHGTTESNQSCYGDCRSIMGLWIGVFCAPQNYRVFCRVAAAFGRAVRFPNRTTTAFEGR